MIILQICIFSHQQNKVHPDLKEGSEMRKIAEQSSHNYTKIRLYEKTKELEEAAKEIERLKKEFQDHKDESEYGNKFVQHFTGLQNKDDFNKYLIEHDKNINCY
jgi:hypothetical protein